MAKRLVTLALTIQGITDEDKLILTMLANEAVNTGVVNVDYELLSRIASSDTERLKDRIEVLLTRGLLVGVPGGFRVHVSR